MHVIELENMRNYLIRLEETIIFALIERAQFAQNRAIYDPGGIPLEGFNKSFLDYFLHETEIIHARVRRYSSSYEKPFFHDLPDPILPPMHYESPLADNDVDVNPKIRAIYIKQIIPDICAPGDCKNYGSCATCDVTCLQALSKRIHFGKFIAEAKFRAETERYTALISDRDAHGILNALVDRKVEARLFQRVRQKAARYGQDPEDEHPNYKVQPETIVQIYQEFIIPLTCEVEVQYLLQRLD